MTSLIAAGGSGRSPSVIPAVPAAWSVTTIAFMGIVSSLICLFGALRAGSSHADRVARRLSKSRVVWRSRCRASQAFAPVIATKARATRNWSDGRRVRHAPRRRSTADRVAVPRAANGTWSHPPDGGARCLGRTRRPASSATPGSSPVRVALLVGRLSLRDAPTDTWGGRIQTAGPAATVRQGWHWRRNHSAANRAPPSPVRCRRGLRSRVGQKLRARAD